MCAPVISCANRFTDFAVGKWTRGQEPKGGLVHPILRCNFLGGIALRRKCNVSGGIVLRCGSCNVSGGRSGFLRVVLSESCRVLTRGGVLALNIDNSQRAQGLCESLIEIAGNIAGLAFCGTIGLQKGAGVGCEPIYLWTKCGDVAQIRNAFLPQPVSLPAPVVEMHDGVAVVRDDLVDGGTKLRGALAYVQHFDAQHFVYASGKVRISAQEIAT